ncbi:MAG TPA: wax ester/triacylglycerol synthase family O-acyltransferase [Steroidobacter sp.]|uniref:wax ester/triacylglycerol synthase family O-acyltransferase n=1 Tax=Steroidobacter sp. TaxID=1978227 RepID=UPI002ED87BA9
MSGESISPVDLAWLRMDSPTNPMVIVAVLILSEPLAYARLKRVLERQLLTFERFLDRPICDALGGHWQRDEQFELAFHLRRLKLPPRAGESQLQAAASRLASTPLDPTRPLWQFHLVERFGKGSAIVGRVHHCYADGVALMRVLLSLTEAAPGASSVPSPASKHVNEASQAPRSLLAPLTGVLGSAETLAQRAIETTAEVLNTSLQALAHPTQAASRVQRIADATRELAKIALLPPDPPTPLKGRLSRNKQVSWAEPLSFAEVKTVAHALGVSINDVLLSTVAGALGAYLESGGTAIDSMTLKALVPVNLRPADQTPRLGNEFGLVFASLPVGERHPLARLYAVNRDMDALKHSSQAVVAFWLLTALGVLPDIVEHEAIELFTTKASAVISNVPGPREPLYVAGVRIERQFFWVPQAGSIGLGVSLLTYHGAVHFGVMADRHLIPHPERITARFVGEFERLLLHVLAGVPPPAPPRPAASTP